MLQGDLQDANYFDFISFAQVNSCQLCPPNCAPLGAELLKLFVCLLDSNAPMLE